MKKTLRSIVTLLLVVVMLFGVAAHTVAYASEPVSESGNGTEENAGQGGSSSPEVFDTGWCEIIYDENEIKLILYPEFEALKDLNKEYVKELISDLRATLVDALQTVFVEDLVKGILDKYYGEDVGVVDGLNIENVWQLGMDAFIESKYGSCENEDYLNFIKDVNADETLVHEFAEYACQLIKTAVKFGIFKADKLPTAEYAEQKINAIFETELSNRATQFEDVLKASIDAYFNARINGAEKDEYFDDVDAGILEVLTEKVKSENPTLTEDQINQIIEQIYSDPVELRDNYFTQIDIDEVIAKAEQIVFDRYSVDDFKAKAELYTSYVIDDYAKCLEDLADRENERLNISMIDLIEYIRGIYVNDMPVFDSVDGVMYVISDSIKQLIEDLPGVGEIRNMTDEEMALSYDVRIVTDFGSAEFKITAELGGGYDYVRKLAAVINDYVEFGVHPNGTYYLNVRMPEMFAKALLKACNSDAIDDEIKQKIFSMTVNSVGDFSALIGDLTFDQVISLLEAVDFTGVLNSDIVKKYIDLSGLTNEQIVAKVREYESYFNKAMEYVAVILDKIPAGAKDITILDLYDGNGQFGLKKSVSVNIEEILCKISEKYGPTIAAYLDITDISASFDISVDIPKVNYVEFVVAGETVNSGFLPADADVAFFADITEYDGMPILAWVDANGNIVTKMPDKDVVLTGVVDKDFEILTGVGVDKTYDGEAHLVQVIVGGAENATVVYEWFKDGVKIDIDTASFEVANVSESGVYTCVATVTEGIITKTLTSEEIVVNISKAVIDATGITWNYTNPFTFNKNNYTVELVGLPAGVSAEYANNVAANAGAYTATVAKLVIDENVFDTANYELSSDIAALSCEWVINPAVVNVSGAEWDYDGALKFNGAEQTVVIKPETIPEGATPVYSGNTATNVGEYTAKVTFEAIDSNYVIEGTVADLQWQIKTDVIVIPESAKWNYTGAFTYDGTEKKLEVVGLPEGVIATYSGNVATNAGEYVAKVTLTSADPNMGISGEIADLTWKINQIVVDVSSVKWNYTGAFTYDGTEKSVALVGLPTGYTATLKGNTATTAGEYTATATINLPDNVNYVVSGAIADLKWTINKVVVDVSSVKWNYTGAFTYDGTEKSVDLVGLPTGYTATLKGNTATAAGEYTATATINLPDNVNYVVSGTIADLKWSIGKITVDISSVKWNYSGAFTFDGTEKKLELVGLPATVTAALSGNVATNAGTYTASAVITLVDSANYTLVGSVANLEWTINKAVVDISGVTWNYSGAFTFDGAEKALELVGLPTTVTATLSGNVATNAGTYTASAVIALVDSDNYTLVGSVADLEWTINKRVIDLSAIQWDYTGALIYNGAEQSVVLTGIPADLAEILGVTYEGNTATVVGTYTATATFTCNSDNFIIEGLAVLSIEWSIDKADYDMSGIRFEDVTVLYDGKLHGLTINGTLPAGVKVTYSASVSAVGVHTITATFTGDYANYNEIAPMTATLTIAANNVNNHVYSDTNGNVIVEVEAENGVPIDNSFVVGDDSHLYTGFKLADGTYAKVITALDISFMKDGVYMPVEDNFTVKMLIPESLRAKANLKVIYIKNDGTIEDIESTRDGDYMVFDTTHFSTYAIVEITDAPVDAEPTDLTWLWILLACLLVVGIIIVIILMLRKKGGDEEPNEDVVEPENEPEGPVDEAPAEETPVEEAPAEEAPAEEAPAEEAPVEEAPKAEPKEIVAPLVILPSEEGDDENVKRAMVGDQIIMVRFRSSFQSRLIQSENEVQDYYTVIKNALLSYKGVKSRTSWNFESFNKGRIQCAKMNIKGKALLVYLNLTPAEYNVNKYHFTDVSDKPKFGDVPMLMKVRSDRALKYVLELIEEMMNKLEIPMANVPNVDYHMPYEDTETLAKRGLVKVILPAGMTLDENSNIVRMDVGALIDSANADKEENETTEAPVEETPVVEAPVVEEAPVEEAPVAAEPEIHVDVVEADAMISDEEAQASIVHIHTGNKKGGGKLALVNVDTICENFENGETVDLNALKAKLLVSKKASGVKILARGVMTKSLTVIADKFSIQAVKMITLAGGTVEIDD